MYKSQLMTFGKPLLKAHKMSHTIFQIAAKNEPTLGSVRCVADLTVTRYQDQLWLKLENQTKEIPLEVRQLPIEATMTLDKEGFLFPQNVHTPVDQVTDLQWIPISEWLPVELPRSVFAGKGIHAHQYEIVPSSEEQQCHGLLTNAQLFYSFVIGTMKKRFGQLRFVVNLNNEVFVVGEQLPSLPGQTFWLEHELWLPAGYNFNLPWLKAIIGKSIQNNHPSYGVFLTDETWFILPKDDLVDVSRSTVRSQLNQ